MKTMRRIATFGLMLMLSSLAMTVSAKPSSGDPPTQPDLYTLVAEIFDQLNGLQSDLDGVSADLATIQSGLDDVSTELGMEDGVFFHSDQGFENVVIAYTDQVALTRFTVTATYYQEEVGDYAEISVSYDGSTWNKVATLDPQPTGSDSNNVGTTTWSSTVVGRQIRIDSYNDIEDLAGNKSTIAWAISAVGPKDSGVLTIAP